MELIKDLIKEEGIKGVTKYYAKLYSEHPDNLDIYTKYIRLLKLDAKMLGFVKRSVEEKFPGYFSGSLGDVELSVFLYEHERALLVYAETCLTLGFYEAGVKVLSNLKAISVKAEYELAEHYVCNEEYGQFNEQGFKLETDLSYVAHSHYNLRIGNYKEAEEYAEEATAMDPKNVLSLLYYYIKVDDIKNYSEVLEDYTTFLRPHQLKELSDYYWKRQNENFDRYNVQKAFNKVMSKLESARYSFTNRYLFDDYDISKVFTYFPEIIEAHGLTPYKTNTKDYYLLNHDENIGRVLNKDVSKLCVVTKSNKPGEILLMEPSLSYKNITFTNPISRIYTALGSDVYRKVKIKKD